MNYIVFVVQNLGHNTYTLLVMTVSLELTVIVVMLSRSFHNFIPYSMSTVPFYSDESYMYSR